MKYKIGDKIEKEYVISYDEGERFADISGDYNPIHIDEHVANKTRFKKRIVHGMLIGSYFSAIIGNEFPGKGSIYMNQNLIFKAPVFYDETIRIVVEIIDIIEEKKRLTLSTKCYGSGDKILVDGSAMIYKEEL